MGQVYAGYDEKLRRRVAVKAIRGDGWGDSEARQRLIREARALARVDHPNICRVYDVLEDEGADYLSLEFIDGRTLQEAVEAGLSFREKVTIAITLADVLAAAHRAGVLHRDLKPDNVMVTAQGEVKVLDFGLARFLDPSVRRAGTQTAAYSLSPPPLPDPDATVRTRPLAPPRRPPDSSETADGIVVGTPLYMSPEQARGEPLTPASDMYALGLILQFLFTGVEPYPPDASAREVMSLAARGKSQAYEGDDPDLRVLIGSLKALAPTDRPTAAAAHRRLLLLSQRPRRKARRLAVAGLALLVVSGAAKYTSDLDRERTAAIAARNDAELRRRQADDLIRFMLGDLRNRLEPVGKLEILDAAMERSLRYFAVLRPEQLSPRDLWQKSATLQRIGALRMDQGKSDEAAVAFRQSLRLAEAATRRAPADAEALYTLGRAHSYLGVFAYNAGDIDSGLEQMRLYLRIAERQAGKSPHNIRFQHEVLNAHSNLGSFSERRGDLEGALLHYQTSLELVTQEAQRPNAPLMARMAMARETNKLAFALFRTGRIEESRRRFAEERAILEGVLAADPKNQFARQRLSVNRDYMALSDLSLGDVDAARREMEAAVETQKALSSFDPANMSWLQGLGNAWRALGDILTLTDPGRARAAYESAAEALRPVLAAPKPDAGAGRMLAGIEIGLARSLQRQGHPAAALQHVRQAVALFAAPPLDAEARRRLAAAVMVRGEVEDALGRRADARKSWEEAAATLSSAPTRSRDPRLLDLRIRILVHVGRAPEAQPAIDALQAMGYRHPDFVAFCSRWRIPYIQAVHA